MRSIVAKGKDVKIAIQLGLDLLEASVNEVDIEIIQNETKGFLGIKSKEAIVKLTKVKDVNEIQGETHEKKDPFELVKESIIDLQVGENQHTEKNVENENLETSDNEINENLSGKVWVQNGRLYCRSSPSQLPMVTIPDNLTLFKNNELVTENTVVITEQDHYELKVENEDKETQWSVTMDEEKLRVLLHITPGYKIIRTIQDIEANHHIKLCVVEQKEIFNTLRYELVTRRLEDLNVGIEINQVEISKALEAKEPGTFEIVTGISPTEGKDGWIELVVDIGVHEGLTEKADGKVDFREIRHIPTIKRGKVIGIIHLQTPGQMGCTVTNVPIPPKPSTPIVLRAGKGVAVVDEDKVVATESGRPKIDQRGQFVKISIMPKLTHVGDVNLSSGNIRFMGDVEIQGEVEANMIVEAEGDIRVQKTVNSATLTTSGAIISYGNIIGSEISAGKNNMLVVELGHLLLNLHQHTENIIDVIKQLTQSPAFKSTDILDGGLQPLIRILLEKKFVNFPPLVRNYVEIVKKSEMFLDDSSWKEIATSLTQLFLILTKEIILLERITELSARMKELHFLSQTTVEPDSYITVPNVLNSRIYCSGNILVLGQGCVNSKIHSGGALKISGVLRGGEVYGRLGVQINEVGAESGTVTMISVPYNQKISIKKAMEGTTIRIANVKHTFKETRYHVEARLDPNNRIIFD